MPSKDSKKTILVSFAHPDDAEFGCAGSVAKWVQEGSEVYYLVATNGDKGSEDPKATSDELGKIRRTEQEEAAKILGVKEVFFLDHPDTELEANLELKEEITRVIRKVKPNLVVTFDPAFLYSKTGYVNHTDHRAIGVATLDAVMPLARDRLTFPDHERQGLKPHRVEEVYLWNFEEQDTFVDISDTFDKKIAALKAHRSQISDEFIEMIKIWNSEAGEKIGSKYAEGFKKLVLSF